MTRRQVWQYWCIFCRKHNLSASSISQHEKHCTSNPNRICRMCIVQQTEQKPIAELVSRLDVRKPDMGLNDLFDANERCPACTLAAIKQSGLHAPGCHQIDGFDWKSESKNWWSSFNERHAEEGGGYY